MRWHMGKEWEKAESEELRATKGLAVIADASAAE